MAGFVFAKVLAARFPLRGISPCGLNKSRPRHSTRHQAGFVFAKILTARFPLRGISPLVHERPCNETVFFLLRRWDFCCAVKNVKGSP